VGSGWNSSCWFYYKNISWCTVLWMSNSSLVFTDVSSDRLWGPLLQQTMVAVTSCILFSLYEPKLLTFGMLCCRWCAVQSGRGSKFLESGFDLENLLRINCIYIHVECGVKYVPWSSRGPVVCWTPQLWQIWEYLIWYIWATHICDNGCYWGTTGISFQPHQLQTYSIQNEVRFYIISWTARWIALQSQ